MPTILLFVVGLLILLAIAAIAWAASSPEPSGRALPVARPARELQSSPASPHHASSQYQLHVLGESEFQEALTRIAAACPDRGPIDTSAECHVTARLVPDDGQGVGASDYERVRVEIEGELVSFLDDGEAHVYPEPYRRLVAITAPERIRALIVGGWDRGPDDHGFYGVRLAGEVEESF